jgi:hypothetical protein
LRENPKGSQEEEDLGSHMLYKINYAGYKKIII